MSCEPCLGCSEQPHRVDLARELSRAIHSWNRVGRGYTCTIDPAHPSIVCDTDAEPLPAGRGQLTQNGPAKAGPYAYGGLRRLSIAY